MTETRESEDGIESMKTRLSVVSSRITFQIQWKRYGSSCRGKHQRASCVKRCIVHRLEMLTGLYDVRRMI